MQHGLMLFKKESSLSVLDLLLLFEIKTFIASVRERMCTLAAKKRRYTLGEANRREVISRIQCASLKQLLLEVSHSLLTETKSDGPWNV